MPLLRKSKVSPAKAIPIPSTLCHNTLVLKNSTPVMIVKTGVHALRIPVNPLSIFISAAFTNTAIALEGWAKDKPKPVLEELNLGTILQRSEYVTAMVSQLQSPWFKYFIKFDPGKYLEQLNCKVLAVDGDKDVQVVSKQNLPGIQASLKKSKTKIYEVKELPGLNHLFQHCLKCTVAEYGELEETISPAALEIIGNWLEKNVKATILK